MATFLEDSVHMTNKWIKLSQKKTKPAEKTIQEFHRNKCSERCTILTTRSSDTFSLQASPLSCGALVDQTDQSGLTGCCPHSQTFPRMLLYLFFRPADAAKAVIFVIVHILGNKRGHIHPLCQGQNTLGPQPDCIPRKISKSRGEINCCSLKANYCLLFHLFL